MQHSVGLTHMLTIIAFPLPKVHMELVCIQYTLGHVVTTHSSEASLGN